MDSYCENCGGSGIMFDEERLREVKCSYCDDKIEKYFERYMNEYSE